jgi:hypothetical protein
VTTAPSARRDSVTSGSAQQQMTQAPGPAGPGRPPPASGREPAPGQRRRLRPGTNREGRLQVTLAPGWRLAAVARLARPSTGLGWHARPGGPPPAAPGPGTGTVTVAGTPRGRPAPSPGQEIRLFMAQLARPARPGARAGRLVSVTVTVTRHVARRHGDRGRSGPSHESRSESVAGDTGASDHWQLSHWQCRARADSAGRGSRRWQGGGRGGTVAVCCARRGACATAGHGTRARPGSESPCHTAAATDSDSESESPALARARA